MAREIVVVRDRSGHAANDFRHLRDRLLALRGKDDAPPRIITVSSAHSPDGKAVFAMNLAAALREVSTGRVLVIDGDLQDPQVATLAGVREFRGIIDVLTTNLAPDADICQTSVTGLDIIAGRPALTPYDHERLFAEATGPLLQKLLPHYSFILIDTPPVLTASHATVFGRHSDGLILVAEMGATPRRAVMAALDECAGTGVTVLGCAFTAPEKGHGCVYRTQPAHTLPSPPPVEAEEEVAVAK